LKKLICIITKDRYTALDILLKSLRNTENIIIIDASENPIKNTSYQRFYNIPNQSIMSNKNMALQIFLKSNVDYLFIIEDDLKILDLDVFDEYIEKSIKYHIPHMNFNLYDKNSLTYDLNEDIAVSEHCNGCFQFFTKECIQKAGLMDTDFKYNCVEHIEHTLRIQKMCGYIPWAWHFPDLKHSSDFIRCQNIKSSRNNNKQINIREFNKMWRKLGGFASIEKKMLKFI